MAAAGERVCARMKHKCLICGDSTSYPIAAVIWHFRPIDLKQREYIRGNFKAFGFCRGLMANVTLMFPFLNTIINWKYRKMQLELEDGTPL